MSGALRVKRLLRPLIPDVVMAQVRLREHSRQVRVNVDVVVERRLEQKRWLATTPDTYRVRSSGTFRMSDTVSPSNRPSRDVIVLADGPLRERESSELLRPLSDPGLAATVLGRASPPRLVGSRRTEPTVAVRAIAVREAAFVEVGGAPQGPHPLPGLLDRLRDAGHPYALLPRAEGGRAVRSDPITHPLSVVILGLVPLHDVGGGSRGAQLAQELLARGAHVTYIAQHGTAESIDLGLRHVHPALEQRRLDQFVVPTHAARVQSGSRLVIVEAPTTHYAALSRDLAGEGYRVVYDLIDDWTAPSLGGDWFDEDVEDDLVQMADGLVGSAPALVDRLTTTSRRPDVRLVPNAVNASIFGADEGPRPRDLPVHNGPILGYHGSLYGDWFDWEALARLAQVREDALVVLIGDPPPDPPTLPPNVIMLGLKAQAELPAYVSRFDVGLVPFVVSPVTHAVSPLKVYEYLACGTPVASSSLDSLRDLAGVAMDDDLVVAVERASVMRPDRQRVLADHGWSARVDAMLETAGLETPPVRDRSEVRVVTRPVVHHTRRDRRVAVA